MVDSPVVAFLRAFAAALEGQPDGVDRAVRALADCWDSGQRSLAFEVRFTGFFRRGELVGGVEPALLRAAQRCILARIDRLGFSPEAERADLDALVRALLDAPATVQVRLESGRPRGIFVGFADGRIYRPAADAVAGPEPPSPAEATPMPAPDSEGEAVDWAAFQLVEDPSAPPSVGTPQTAESAPTASGGESTDEWYGLFRSTTARVDTPIEDGLARCENIAQYGDLWQRWVETVQRATATGDTRRVVDLLRLAHSELQRPDRRRPFQELASHAIRTVMDEATLRHWVAWAVDDPSWRPHLWEVLPFASETALPVVERLFGALAEPSERAALVAAVARAPQLETRLLERIASEAYGPRARLWVEALAGAEVPPPLRQRWLETLARHAEPSVRAAVAQAASAVGGRTAVRLLVEFLGDRERLVRREAIAALGRLGEPAAIPFLARLAGDDSDDALQLEAIAALGASRLPEAVSPLRQLLERRARFGVGGRRHQRRRAAALEALARLPFAPAREAVAAVAASRDDLAPLAARLLAAAQDTSRT